MKRYLLSVKLFIIISLALVSTATGYGQSTYVWNQTIDGIFTTSTNWTPERATPATDDILVFSNGGTYSVTGVTTQTIGKLRLTDNSKVTLQPAVTAQTLTIGNGADTDLEVATGCELNISGSLTLTLALPTGATGSISGNMTFAGGAHKLTAADASAISFNSGAVFTAGTGFSGNPFGNTFSGSVIFGNGSTFVYQSGSNPFAISNPVCVFQTGSLYKHKSTNTPSFSGRTYANFELDATGTVSGTGGSALTIDNLTVTQGTLNLNMTAIGTVLKGNINVNTGATLTFSPASAGNVTFSGSTTQTINNSGTFTIGANASVVLNQDIVLNCPATIAATLNLKDKTVSGTGTLTVNSTGTVMTANAAGLDATVLTVANKTFDSGANYVFNGTTAQVTGDLLPSAIKTLTVNNTEGVTLTADQTVNTALVFTSGNLTLGDHNLIIASGGNIASDYNRYVVTSGTGRLSMVFADGSTPLFGFGTSTSYAPVICSITTSGNTLTGSVSSTITHPALHNDRLVQLEWNFVETGGFTNTGNCIFAWNNEAAKGTGFDITKPVVFASWSGTDYNQDDVTVTDLGNGMYGVAVSLPPNIPNTPLLVGNKAAFFTDGPSLTADETDNDVEHDIVITFTDNSSWRAAITGVSVNGTDLSFSDYVLAEGTLTLKPSVGNPLLTTSGSKVVSIMADDYNDATVTQRIKAGALSSTYSTVSFAPALNAGTTTVCTLTAKDQYQNLIEGYVFKGNITITDADVMTDESYTVNGTAITASVTGMILPATEVTGISTFDIVLPAVIDGDDGISVQIKLNDGTTDIGSAASFTSPSIPNIRIAAPVALTETNLNGATVNVTVANEIFADNTIVPASITLNNTPSGLTVNTVTWQSTTTAAIVLAFTGADFDATINNFNITIAGTELALSNPLTSNNLTITAVTETTPVVTTNAAITASGMFTATWGGEVTADGGSAVTQKGLCWSLIADPTIDDSKTEEGAGSGTIEGAMTGLTANTEYHVRAYATNGVGTSYGDDHSFTTLAPFEDFADYPETSTSYKDGTFDGRDGSIWSYFQCSGNADVDITAPSPVLGKGRTPVAEVRSGTIHGGIGKLSFKFAESFTSAVNLDVYVNDIKVANATTLATETMVVKTISDINVYVTGDFTLKFIQNNASSGQVTIDDISWTPYGPSVATAEVPRFSPFGGSYLGALDISLTTATADAEIHYTTDGTDPTPTSTLYTGPVHITSTTTIKAIAVKTGLENSPIVSSAYTIEEITDVANITALRAGETGSKVYRLTGEAFLTYQQASRNQKYLQDANAGILIDDAAGIITTSYNLYDGITGITGRLGTYGGVLQFVPIFNTAAATSTGNAVTPIIVTVSELNTNYETYESRLIRVVGVSFSSTGSFAASANYNFTDGTNSAVFRTAFGSADYIGGVIPTVKVNLTGIGMEYNGTAQIASRNLADIYLYSTAKAITSFAFNGLTPAVNAVINEGARTITATVPAGTNRATLVPTIAISDKAGIDPASGTARDFTNPVTYTVTAEDGTTAVYTVTVSLATGIDNNLASRLMLYPIPARDKINVRNIEDVNLIEVFDITGNKHFTEVCDGQNIITIPVSHLARGIYFIRFTTPNNTVMKRFVKD